MAVAASTDKALNEYPGMRHQPFQAGRGITPRIIKDIKKWLLARVK